LRPHASQRDGKEQLQKRRPLPSSNRVSCHYTTALREEQQGWTLPPCHIDTLVFEQSSFLLL